MKYLGVMVGIIFAVGCGKNNEPTNETKPLEEKQQAIPKVADLPLLPDTITK